MTPEGLFSLCNTLVLPAWLLLIFAPRWQRVTPLVATWVVPVALGLVYLGIMATQLGTAEGGFQSLAGVGSLFSNPWVLLAGWVHYLAFDLFVGAWEVRDSARTGVPHLWVVPCLALTFMLGPVGLVAYFALRVGWKRQLAV